jgi:transcriptional regulator with XRE-family HTH domain
MLITEGRGIVISTIGSRIRSLREARNWTQEDLCSKLGINNTVLSKIESDKRKVEAQELAKIADVFNVSTDYLTGRITSFVEKNKSGLGVAEQSASAYGKDSGMAFYGGGKDWTDEEIEFAEAMIQKLREQKEAKAKNDQKGK